MGIHGLNGDIYVVGSAGEVQRLEGTHLEPLPETGSDAGAPAAE